MLTSPGITGPNDALQQFEDPMELIQAKRKQALALELMKQLQGGPQMPQQTQILAKMPILATLAHMGAQSNARNQLADADKQNRLLPTSDCRYNHQSNQKIRRQRHWESCTTMARHNLCNNAAIPECEILPQWPRFLSKLRHHRFSKYRVAKYLLPCV